MIIRDPVHGDIRLTAAEVEILDTAEMQRLRGIKQTGTANLAYPGCVHTRFDHSLGTLALARRIMDHLDRNGFAVGVEEAQAVALAALLHDVTHVPYGHTLEDERHLFPRHDAGCRLDWLLEGDLGGILRRQGYLGPVTAILRHKGTGEVGDGGLEPWMAQVVSSTIDADLLDYLRRDSFFAGLRHDYDERIFTLFMLSGGDLALNLSRGGMDRPDARSEVLQVLRTRYFLTERIYFHHTKVCSGAMVAKAVELALDLGFEERDLLRLSDDTLLDRLDALAGKRGVGHIPRLTERLRKRALLKRGYVVSTAGVDRHMRRELIGRFLIDSAGRRAAEEDLARVLGLDPAEVIIYCSGLSMMKESSALVHTGAGFSRLNDPAADPPSELRVLEELYEALWRFYIFVPRGHEESCRKEGASLTGLPSER